MVNLQAFKFGDRNLFDASHRFETSWILPPWVLFACRALISLYTFTTLLFIIGLGLSRNEVGAVRLNFSYFTVLTYWGISFYFAVAAIHTFSYALHGGTPLLNRMPRPLQALHHLYYTTITTYPLLVTIVYWGILFGGFKTTYDIWSNTSQHAMNTLFALFEITMTRVDPAPWIHLLWLIVILSGYLGLAYVTVATKGVYVYSFLSPKPKDYVNADGVAAGGVGNFVAAYVFGIAIGICILFCVSKYLVTLRKFVTEKKLGMMGKFKGGRDLGQGDTELETQRVWEKPAGEA